MKRKPRIYVIKVNRRKLLISAIIIVLIGMTAILKKQRIIHIFNPKNQQTIVIDPGHGGIDGGTGDRNDILEKDINLDVGLKLKKELLVEGFDVIMTREDDVSLENLSSINASRYRRDLDARKNIINENDPLVFISIHVNSSKKTSVKGIKVYHFPNSVEGEKLAKSIAESVDIYVYDKFLKDTSLRAEILSENFYILRETKHTGVLVEVGFITNPEENKLMKNRKYKEKVAFAIKKGILEYLSQD